MEQILDMGATTAPINAYGGFWRRLVAYIIDTMLLQVVSTVLSLMFFGTMFIAANPEVIQANPFAFLSNLAVFLLIMVCLNWIYYAYFESSARQATPGKMAMSLRVCNERGERISFANASGRYFGKWLSSLILCIGFLMVAFDSRKQGLHDKLAKTLVVKD